MPDNRQDLTRTDIETLLGKLDEELVRRGHVVTVYVVGGANIALTVDAGRTTIDIDAVVKHGYDNLVSAAAAVAATEPGLAADWINAEFTGGNNPTGGLFWQWFDHRDHDTPKDVFHRDALSVEAASPEMMLALKTLANRDQDIVDAFKLMRITGIRTPTGIGRNLARFTGRRIFEAQGTGGIYPRIDPSFPHIFDNLPADLAPPHSENQQPAKAGKGGRRWASAPRCGLVKVSYANGQIVERTAPCVRRKGHLLPHRFRPSR